MESGKSFDLTGGGTLVRWVNKGEIGVWTLAGFAELPLLDGVCYCVVIWEELIDRVTRIYLLVLFEGED